MMKKFATPLTCAALVALAGCGVFKGGGKHKTPTVGERIPILVSETAAEVDKTIATVPVSVPPAAPNDSWAQPGGSAAKSNGHLALAATPARLWSAQIPGGNPRERR